MLERITINKYIEKFQHIPVIDVRSPIEFNKGQIPGSYNIPLFTDQERAEIGTMYKQTSKQKALDLGYSFVTPKLDWFISEASKIAPNKTAIVHCWRGGMRSQSFADHLHNNGFNNVYVIEGGYKAFRNYVHSFFENTFKLKILGGYTGSGKTDVLDLLTENGEQLVDLEQLANHKGSAFGAIGEDEQPTVEQFENLLFEKMYSLDIDKSIWLEDESMGIGRVYIPRPLFLQMREQKVFFLDIPVEERAKYLVKTYGLFEKDKLKASILKISKRLGNDRVKIAIEALEKGDLQKVAEITLKYYDKAYLRGLESRDKSNVIKIPIETVNPKTSINALLNCSRNLDNKIL